MPRKRRSFSVELKLQAIQWHNENGQNVTKTAQQFDIDRKRVREWLSNEDMLRLNSVGQKKRMKKISAGK